MSHTVTAIFATPDVAQSVVAQIRDLGVSERHVNTFTTADQADDVSQIGLPDDEAITYRRAIQKGHSVVSADIDAEQVDAVSEIMRHPEHGVDIDAYEAEYRGTPDYDRDVAAYGAAGAAAAGTTASGGAAAVEGEEVIPVVEERLVLSKRETTRGTAHVRAYVHEIPVEERIRLREERIEIERRATPERVVTGSEADALFQERNIDVTERSEEAVVSKEAVVTEEVVVRKEIDDHEEVVSDTVRKTEVEVDKDRT